jgi:hypothetical protein
VLDSSTGYVFAYIVGALAVLALLALIATFAHNWYNEEGRRQARKEAASEARKRQRRAERKRAAEAGGREASSNSRLARISHNLSGWIPVAVGLPPGLSPPSPSTMAKRISTRFAGPNIPLGISAEALGGRQVPGELARFSNAALTARLPAGPPGPPPRPLPPPSAPSLPERA